MEWWKDWLERHYGLKCSHYHSFKEDALFYGRSCLANISLPLRELHLSFSLSREKAQAWVCLQFVYIAFYYLLDSFYQRDAATYISIFSFYFSMSPTPYFIYRAYRDETSRDTSRSFRHWCRMMSRAMPPPYRTRLRRQPSLLRIAMSPLPF